MYKVVEGELVSGKPLVGHLNLFSHNAPSRCCHRRPALDRIKPQSSIANLLIVALNLSVESVWRIEVKLNWSRRNSGIVLSAAVGCAIMAA